MAGDSSRPRAAVPAMIFDSHCHAWRRWPYDARVPDPEHRGSVEALLYEMDSHGVQRAAVVCAHIGHELGLDHANHDNNDYVAAAVARHPDRLVMLADVDSFWLPGHHTPGAASRLRECVDRYAPVGFTHYVTESNDGWLASDDGRELFATAAELDLIASLALTPAWLPDVRALALQHPTLPILLHHYGVPRPGTATFDADLAAVLDLADAPNVVIKVSGLHYLVERSWQFPYDEARARVFGPVLATFGAHRMVWGSDFPAGRWHLTYTQSLEVTRTLEALTPGQASAILGGTMEELVRSRRPV
jgi:L-fuconolactonase